jgi:hypothetical protein
VSYSGDADIYVRREENPTKDIFDWKSEHANIDILQITAEERA